MPTVLEQYRGIALSHKGLTCYNWFGLQLVLLKMVSDYTDFSERDGSRQITYDLVTLRCMLDGHLTDTWEYRRSSLILAGGVV